MKPVATLEAIRPWCDGAKVGDHETFSIAGEVVQAQATALAREMNEERNDHLWVEVLAFVLTPEVMTEVRVRCSP